MIARTRHSAAAMHHAHAAKLITSMPASIRLAILGAAVRLTDAPWCSVFHQRTEK